MNSWSASMTFLFLAGLSVSACTFLSKSCCCPAVLTSGGGSQQHSPLKRSVSLTPPMSGPSNQPLGHVWLSQEDLRTTRGPAPDHAPLSPQSSIASSGSGGSEHLEEAGLGGGSGLQLRSSFHEEGSGMRGAYERLVSVQMLWSTIVDVAD